MQRDLITYPTWERYTVLSHAIANLSVRDRRSVFMMARMYGANASGDLFFPQFGFTLSEFAVWYVLGDRRRKSRSKKADVGVE